MKTGYGPTMPCPRTGSNRRWLLRAALGGAGAIAGCGPNTRGSPSLLSRLETLSREQGIAIGFFNGDCIYIKDFLNPNGVRVSQLATGTSAGTTSFSTGSLVNWGRALALQSVKDSGALLVKDLNGRERARIDCGLMVQGCSLDVSSDRLLFWGVQRSKPEYLFYVARLREGTLNVIYRFSAEPTALLPKIAASFVETGSRTVRVCVDTVSLLVNSDTGERAREPWQLEYVEGPQKGKPLAGRRPDGTLVFVDIDSGRITETNVITAGRSRWDPSSRYVMSVLPKSHFPFLPREIVIVDSLTLESVVMPAIIPDDQDRPYVWVLQRNAA